MAGIVYILCALTSLACAILLWRAYAQSRMRLLAWSGVCFAFLFINNTLLFIDLRVMPGVDLAIVRTVPSLLGVLFLLFGLVWESD